jgi:hypothetical protein
MLRDDKKLLDQTIKNIKIFIDMDHFDSTVSGGARWGMR